MEIGLQMEFCMHKDGTLRFGERLCVPNDLELKREILRKAHSLGYTVHPGSTKMYKDLKMNFWWNNMKREIAQYVAQGLVCQQVKVEHQRPTAFMVGFSLERFAKLYIKEIVKLYGIPVTIVSDKDSRFVSMFWRSLHTALDTSLNFSMTFHPQSDGQSPICWDDVGERKLLGPKIVQQTVDKINLIREQLRTAQSRQKSYADNRRRDLVFGVGDHVFLNVSPMKRVMRFGVRGKLSPRFIGPFEVLDRIGEFKEDLTYEEHLVRIVDKKEQVLRRRVIHYVKVQWSNHSEREATWELEDEMRQKYKQLLETTG
ncbi:uncharacterized protein LOC114257246 [Camellia sinensis]|uniref:uncharacterized protein LOC114257246 n=1 Tax=Camellia sinensis TaxID=4442 RepID=UPI00103612BE|nr:uncharacterized protein LOC114257246 [Camellia sinensis]